MRTRLPLSSEWCRSAGDESGWITSLLKLFR